MGVLWIPFTSEYAAASGLVDSHVGNRGVTKMRRIWMGLRKVFHRTNNSKSRYEVQIPQGWGVWGEGAQFLHVSEFRTALT